MSGSDRNERLATKLVAGIIAAVAAVLIVAAICLGLYQQSKYVDEAAQRSAEYAKHARDKVGQTCAAVPAPEKASCVEKAETEQQLAQADNERNEKDLVAQRTSALWTAIMGVAALIGMGLSAVGVWLVFDTFRATRRATEIADDNLEAIVDSERARIRMAEIAEINNAPNEPEKLSLQVTAENIGKSTATIQSVHWYVAQDADWPDKFEHSRDLFDVAEPGKEAIIEYLTYKPPVIETHFISGYVVYKTILGRSFTTYFSYWASRNIPSRDVISLREWHAQYRRWPGQPDNT